jgi:hypothetical protein
MMNTIFLVHEEIVDSGSSGPRLAKASYFRGVLTVVSVHGEVIICHESGRFQPLFSLGINDSAEIVLGQPRSS